MIEKLPVGVNLHTCGKHQAKRDKPNKKQQIVISRPKAVVALLIICNFASYNWRLIT
jgi:hypothetical protein